MRESKLHWPSAQLCFLYTWLGLLTVLQMSAGAPEIQTLYLNSHKDCGQKTFPVTKNLMYKVKTDVSPRTATKTFRTCEMTFHAEEEDGRLCLVQDHPTIQINDKNAQLTASDGVDNSHSSENIFKVKYAGNLGFTEKCTKSRYINLLLSKVNDGSVDITNLTINLKVMHISSSRRRLDMDKEHCEKTYSLDHSEINIYNRQRPEDTLRTYATKLQRLCQLTFVKDSTDDRSICMVYIPQGKPDCSSDWSLIILSEKNTLDDEHTLYKLKCTEQKAPKIGAWCAPSNKTGHITLLHMRGPGVTIWSNETKLERPEMYRIIVTDFLGGDTKELLRRTEAQLSAQAGGKSASFSMWWLVLFVGIAILLIIALFAYFSRRNRCGRKKSRGSETTDRESSIARREEDEDEEDE